MHLHAPVRSHVRRHQMSEQPMPGFAAIPADTRRRGGASVPAFSRSLACATLVRKPTASPCSVLKPLFDRSLLRLTEIGCGHTTDIIAKGECHGIARSLFRVQLPVPASATRKKDVRVQSDIEAAATQSTAPTNVFVTTQSLVSFPVPSAVVYLVRQIAYVQQLR